MAIATPCQTSGAQFHSEIKTQNFLETQGTSVSMTVDIPFDLGLSEQDAKILEANMHNALELVLAPYFRKE